MLEMLSVMAIIAGLSLLIVIHEAGHFFIAKYFGLLVEEFGFGLPPRIWGKKIGETLYSFNWLPFGGFVRIFGESQKLLMDVDGNTDLSVQNNLNRAFYNQLIWRRALIVVAGVAMNFLLGWGLIAVVFWIGIPQSVLVTEIKEGGLAEIAGIQKGDQFIDYKNVGEFTEFIERQKGQETSLGIQRAGKKILITITPRSAVPDGEGNLGIYIAEAGLPKSGFLKGITEGFLTSIKIVWTVFLGLIDLVIGVFTDISILDRFVGPVGVVNAAIETTKLGLIPFIQLLAMLSLNLAVFNVIPVPALDGGRLLFLLIEKLKGSPLNPKTEVAVNGIGFAFLLLLILAITVKDIFTLL